MTHTVIVFSDGRPATPFAPAALSQQGTQVLFVSGQLGEGADGELVSPDAGEQAEQCFRNIDALLTAAGATRTDVVKLGMFMTDLVSDRAAVAAARTAYFGDHIPASTAYQVAGLVIPDARVEVEAIAVF